MDAVDQLRSEINDIVIKKLPIIVLENEIRLHGRRHAHKCECTYCQFLPQYVANKIKYKRHVNHHYYACNTEKALFALNKEKLDLRLKLSSNNDCDIFKMLDEAETEIERKRKEPIIYTEPENWYEPPIPIPNAGIS